MYLILRKCSIVAHRIKYPRIKAPTIGNITANTVNSIQTIMMYNNSGLNVIAYIFGVSALNRAFSYADIASATCANSARPLPDSDTVSISCSSQ